MTIVLVGLDYRTTPLELRERLHLSGDNLHCALDALHSEALEEVVIVSTCNRLEVYAGTPNAEQAIAVVSADVAKRTSLTSGELRQHLRILCDQEAVDHLMRVTCGLESLVLGETEILGQVADAFIQAQRAGTTKANLSRLFQYAIRVGKRARAETAISQHTLSVSHAAVLLAQQQVPHLANANALIIGAGRMAELAVRALKAHGVQRVTIANRTFSRAKMLADRTGSEALEWQQLREALSQADIVITATSAHQPILKVADIKARLRPLLMIDIAVPRNVHSRVRALPNVQLYDIDALQAVVADHRSKRLSEVGLIERLIVEQREAFFAWVSSRSAVSTIVRLRQHGDDMAAAELNRALRRLPELSERERDVVAQMAHRLVHKLLHAPTTALHDHAALDDRDYLHAVRRLFDLEATE